MSYEGPWRNRIHQLYTQFCYPHEAPDKLRLLIERYGSAFDDKWHYKIAGRSLKVIIRRPLWLDKSESGRNVEKASHHRKKDHTLKEYMIDMKEVKEDKTCNNSMR